MSLPAVSKHIKVLEGGIALGPILRGWASVRTAISRNNDKVKAIDLKQGKK